MQRYINKILSIAVIAAGLCSPAFCVEKFMPPVPDETETLLLSGDLIAEEANPVEETSSANEAAPETPKKEKKTKNTPVISNISIEGNKIIRNSEIMNAMKMQVGDVYSPENIQRGLTEIYNLGWFTEKMRAIPLKDENNNIVLKIYVEENKTITDFTITGNTVVSAGEISELLAPLENQPQNISTLNSAVEKIEELYASKGYILARVSQVQDDPDGCVNINISEGMINSVKFEGNNKTKDYVVNRNILSVPGTVYNENTIKEDLIRLYGTQAFKDVNRTIERCDDNSNYYDVTINLIEQRTATISLGGGLDTATGFFGQAGFIENNFMGKGQRISINFLAGTGVLLSDDSTLNRANFQGDISFFEPRFMGTDVSMLYKGYWQNYASYQIPLAMERRFGLEAVASKQFRKFRNLSGSFKIGVENVNLKEGDFLKIASLYKIHGVPISERAKQLKGGTFLSLSPSLVYDTRDRLINPRDGLVANIRFTENLGLNDFGSTHGTLTGGVRKYIPVMTKSALSITARAGGTIHGDIPEVMAFRLGGPYSVRGYKMSSIGTGNSYVMGSVELTTPLFFLDRIKKLKFLDNVKFAVFADAGKLFNTTVSDVIYNRPGYGVAIGAGIKVYVPGVGPLSIDYGYPLTNVGDGNSKGAFTFGIGDLF
ncbi:MAG: BamA/TamA family outer membrane protein [Candidatus Gastranaerophilales bacterium]|nr:BamA/TamA family outer membrane protein [Candidatus Gastranaerophilales bacterium]